MNKLKLILGKTGEAAKHFLYPSVCQICEANRAVSDEGLICADCREGVRPLTSPYCGTCGMPFEGRMSDAFECANCREMNLKFDFAQSAVIANELLRDVIHRYKYRRELWFEPFLGGLLLDAMREARVDEAWDAFVPVPLYPVKLREREFNQSTRLAQWIGKRLDRPVWDGFLTRTRPTPTQTALTRKQRLENVKRAFVAKSPDRARNRSLIIVDDVLTTGATTSACADALRTAGAARIGVWTVARASFSPDLA